MTEEELFEEIRTLLNEPQVATVEDPWTYTDEDLALRVRSAFRRFEAWGINFDSSMSSDGTLTGDLDLSLGLLTALFVASSLLRGDLVRKLNQGLLGMVYRDEGMVIDTKTATTKFSETAKSYETRFNILKTRILSGIPDPALSSFGDSQTAGRG